ncbi:hypothetical protein DOTSEDRAFT_71351 [Dothistroma septosporum NZE10]|uniref:Transcription factor domain-containing protein n=1 Tax=Dothistroma septosporum (strain NZE10 / CBS 128990) TaxID=675120 RepID=N1PQG6_DOTSN|nr:hypothetical protein DOTSEDRAFT_71351 [Dothistroma septosporum NZE10]
MSQQPSRATHDQDSESHGRPAKQLALQWVSFEPGSHGNTVSNRHRKEVRAAAARASHAVRRAQREADADAETKRAQADGQADAAETAAQSGSRQQAVRRAGHSNRRSIADKKSSHGKEAKHECRYCHQVVKHETDDCPDNPSNGMYRRSPSGGRSSGDESELWRSAAIGGPDLDILAWKHIIGNAILHGVSLFVVSTHTNLLGLHSRDGPVQSCALTLRGQALRGMQKAYKLPPEPSPSHGGTALAISLGILAGWEKVYGEESYYKSHLQALRVLEKREGDADIVDEDRVVRLMQSVPSAVHVELGFLQDLITSDGSLELAANVDEITLRSPKSTYEMSELDQFDHHRPSTRTLLFLLVCLSKYEIMDANAWSAIHELSLFTFAWRGARPPPWTWSNLTSDPELEELALYHIRAGMVAVLGAWTYATGNATKDDGYFRASDAMDVHYHHMTDLESDPLVGTKFESAALWAVFIITCTATPKLWQSQTFDLLRRLMASPRLHIDTYAGLESVLRQYAYREVIHKKNGLALYETVMTGVLPGDDIGLRTLEISLADLML